jgi:hypothetical protein
MSNSLESVPETEIATIIIKAEVYFSSQDQEC